MQFWSAHKAFAHVVPFLLFAGAALYSCMEYGPMDEEDFDQLQPGLFITNEGNYMYGNASLSYYIPSTKEIVNEVFIRANGINLGDVAHSMTIRDGLGYVVVNNSGIIFVVDTDTFKVVGTIGPMTSPRYIHFVSDDKAYVTQIWDPRIVIVNPRTFGITGYIETGMGKGGESTEQMVQYGKYVFTNCWSYDNRILVIDTDTDEAVDEIIVGSQPSSLVLDANDKLWTLTEGDRSLEMPSLYRIDAQTRKIERQFPFAAGDSPRRLCLNGTRDTLYFINKAVWRMKTTDEQLPQHPFLEDRGTLFYGLSVDPATSEVYVADAIDYVQPGMVYRYSPEAELIDRFRVGITPGSFCFK